MVSSQDKINATNHVILNKNYPTVENLFISYQLNELITVMVKNDVSDSNNSYETT